MQFDDSKIMPNSGIIIAQRRNAPLEINRRFSAISKEVTAMKKLISLLSEGLKALPQDPAASAAYMQVLCRIPRR